MLSVIIINIFEITFSVIYWRHNYVSQDGGGGCVPSAPPGIYVYGALCTLRSFIFTKLKVHNQSSVDKKICTECHTEEASVHNGMTKT